MNGFNLSDIQDAKLGGTQLSAIYFGSSKLWPTAFDYSQEYLTIESLADNNTISFNNVGSDETKTIYWSSDKTTWNSVSTADSDTTLKTLSNNEKIYIKGSNNNYSVSTTVYNHFNSDYEFNISGNIMSLIYGDNFIGQTTLPWAAYIFNCIFRDSKLVDASNLILPATTLTDSCYRSMFYGCTSLISAPVLPATTLAPNCYRTMFKGCALTDAPVLSATTMAENCYYYMFQNCTSLTAPPVLPATTLAQYCYTDMFYGCTSLTSAPVLSATTLTDSCYREMFKGCSSLTSAPPALPATTLAANCYRAMFSGCALTAAPVLPATTLADYCYYYMFEKCTSLTTAPELPATILAQYCYQRMFTGCTSLNYIKCLATNISATSSHESWLYKVAATGTFVKPTSMTKWPSGAHGIPNGWTVVNV